MSLAAGVDVTRLSPEPAIQRRIYFMSNYLATSRAIVLLLIVSTAVLVTQACKEEEYVEQAGFTCTIDGRSWWPMSDNIAVRPTTCRLKNEGGRLEIKAFDSKTQSEIGISVSNGGVKIKAGTYILNSNGNSAYYDKGKAGGNYMTTSGYDGSLTIASIDYQAKTVEATFNYRAFNAGRQETIGITNGILRLEYIVE